MNARGIAGFLLLLCLLYTSPALVKKNPTPCKRAPHLKRAERLARLEFFTGYDIIKRPLFEGAARRRFCNRPSGMPRLCAAGFSRAVL